LTKKTKQLLKDLEELLPYLSVLSKILKSHSFEIVLRKKFLIKSEMADDTLSLKELEEALECPICCNLPQSVPIYQCENGHMICKICHEKLTNCPSCQQPLQNIRCMFAEQMLEKTLVLCQFSVHGCKTKLKIKDKNEHAAQCLFRKVDCTDMYCKKRISVCNLRNHIQSCHAMVKIAGYEYESDIYFTDPYRYPPSYNPYNILFENAQHVFILKEHEFCNQGLHRIHSQGLIFLWVIFTGTSKEATKYKCEIKISNKDETENHIYSGPPISVDVPFKDAIDSKQGLVVMRTTMMRLLNEVDKFKLKIQIETL